MKALVSSGLPKFCLIALILTLIATAAKIAYGETNSSQGFFTKAISYLQPVGSGISSIKPLVTTNDTTNGGEYTFPEYLWSRSNDQQRWNHQCVYQP